MAIMRIRDAQGNVQEILVIKGDKGDDYVLTDDDKAEIVDAVLAALPNGDEVSY